MRSVVNIAGDEVCILGGADMPFISRREEDHFKLVLGECYFDNLMDGEVVQAVSYRLPIADSSAHGQCWSMLSIARAQVPKMMVQLKQEVLEAASEKYRVLEDCWINIR